MEKKYCRICWNSANWTKPTGEAADLETGSFVTLHGVGLEEWLFDMGWPLQGFEGDRDSYCYGFLQPIGKYRHAYVRQTTDICLYTVDPTGKRLFVGTIRNVYVPDDDECEWVKQQWTRSGRLRKMDRDLREIGVDDYDVTKLEPQEIVNIRFRSADVEIFDPRSTAPRDHVVSRTSRYHPFNWNGDLPLRDQEFGELPAPNEKEEANPNRSEALRHRAAVAGTQFSPDHVRLQNALRHWLEQRHGPKVVEYERNFIDLAVRKPESVTFYEIKTAVTAKQCVREALGQLLEYGHYATKSNAHRLVVVGSARPTEDDKAYLDHLRNLYALPINYERWSWERRELEAGI